MARSDLLRKVPLFRGVSDEDLERLALASREESYASEANIVEIGEPGERLFVILEGSVRVLYPARSEEFELAQLTRGDFFGEMALLNDKPRSATVRAVDPVKVLTLDKQDFRRIIQESPDVALKLLEVLSFRIRNADEQISGLSDKAMRDQLTGLLNRRAFHERFNEEIDRSNRYKDTFSLILLDVDRFKSVNDTFGHDAGDAILTWVGRIMTEHTRSADAPFRVGGEEFAILAPATGAETANMVATRLIATIAEARPPVDFDLKVTLSGGYASCPDHASRSDALFSLADQALLRAKAEGRNRICKPMPQPPVGKS